jgi:hypothetical protein
MNHAIDSLTAIDHFPSELHLNEKPKPEKNLWLDEATA